MKTKVAKFIRDLEDLYKRHGLSLGHEDDHGAFIIRRFEEGDVESLRHASDETDKEPEPLRVDLASYLEKRMKAFRQFEPSYNGPQLIELLSRKSWIKLEQSATGITMFATIPAERKAEFEALFDGYLLG